MKTVEKIKKNMFYNIFSENRAVNQTMWKILESWAGHKWQYGARVLHFGYLSLKTHTQNKNAYWFVLQQWLYEHASMLGYSLVFFFVDLLIYDWINY